MTGIKDLWDDGKLSIVQGVVPEPQLLPLRSTDIWETGADSNMVLDSGWLGRYLNMEYPNYPVGYPNTDVPDPLAIRIGGPGEPGAAAHGREHGRGYQQHGRPLEPGGQHLPGPGDGGLQGRSSTSYARCNARRTNTAT